MSKLYIIDESTPFTEEDFTRLAVYFKQMKLDKKERDRLAHGKWNIEGSK